MTLICQGNYGNCLALLGRFEVAAPLVTKSYEKLAATFGLRHDHTILAIRRCILLCETWSKPDLIALRQARCRMRSAPPLPG